MNCEKCGASLPENITFCPQCGAELTPEPSLPDAVDAVKEQAREALELAARAMEETSSVVPDEVAEAAEDALEQAAHAIEEPQPEAEAQPETEAEPEPETCNEEDPAWEEPVQPQGRVNFAAPIYTRGPEEYRESQGSAAPAPKAAVSGELPGPLDYFLMQLVTGLPLIGLIISIVWAADPTVTHRKNYALGNLLYRLVVLVVRLLIAAIVLSILNLLVSRLAMASPYLGGFNGFNGFFY